ncbi:hypothetical protein [Paenibacillus sp. NFR01]|uniref:hypothetical protein n=1 Tax=Paenibacillus sp. NFR01 TaxID=1566279 RepID=UPI0008AEB41B|nr:hypothetical protein [Paenibacillus sp. NFR01]SET34053.1 hypothetical protein SAMN03159358_1387 [Paenibacillus sp. NFR01]
MARTKTQKAIRKADLSGLRCPEQNRRSNEDFGAISQHTRLTPTKRQQLNKMKHKERIYNEDGAPFLCPIIVWRPGFTLRES